MPGGNVAVDTEASVSPVRLEVMLYFQRNPFARETVESLSIRLGRPTNLIRDAVERLTEQTVLEGRTVGQQIIFRYKRPFLGSSHSSGR